MKKLRIYVDTSVVGGCFDPEFAEWSNRLLDRFRRGEFTAHSVSMELGYKQLAIYSPREVVPDETDD